MDKEALCCCGIQGINTGDADIREGSADIACCKICGLKRAGQPGRKGDIDNIGFLLGILRKIMNICFGRNQHG